MTTPDVDSIIRRFHEANSASQEARRFISEASKIKKETARAMKAEGATNRVIAIALGVSHQRVSQLLMSPDHVVAKRGQVRVKPDSVAIPWQGDDA